MNEGVEVPEALTFGMEILEKPAMRVSLRQRIVLLWTMMENDVYCL